MKTPNETVLISRMMHIAVDNPHGEFVLHLDRLSLKPEIRLLNNLTIKYKPYVDFIN